MFTSPLAAGAPCPLVFPRNFERDVATAHINAFDGMHGRRPALVQNHGHVLEVDWKGWHGKVGRIFEPSGAVRVVLQDVCARHRLPLPFAEQLQWEWERGGRGGKKGLPRAGCV